MCETQDLVSRLSERLAPSQSCSYYQPFGSCSSFCLSFSRLWGIVLFMSRYTARGFDPTLCTETKKKCWRFLLYGKWTEITAGVQTEANPAVSAASLEFASCDGGAEGVWWSGGARTPWRCLAEDGKWRRMSSAVETRSHQLSGVHRGPPPDNVWRFRNDPIWLMHQLSLPIVFHPPPPPLLFHSP